MSSNQQTSAAFRPAKRRAAPNDEEVNVVTGTGRAKACTSCRQVKLKCDSAETFPASCSRCTAKSLDCRMDADFKRIPTRHKLEEVTSELSNLKEVIRSSAAPQNLHIKYSRRSNSQNSPSPDGGLLEPPVVGQKGRSFFDGSSLGFYGIEDSRISAFGLGDQSLGDVHLTGVAIVDLFEHFQQHYYRHGVVLDTSLTLHELSSQSPLLLWTIIMTSSRHHYSTIFQSLKQPYEHLLASHIIRAIHSIHTIHAILILVTWPIPVRSQPEDPSWNLCGLMTNAARGLGYHQSGREKEYGFPRATPREVELRSVTWLQIFHANITYSSRLGVPPALTDEPTLRGIVQITTDFDIPSDVAIQLEILRTLARFMQCLQLQTDPTTLDSLILMASGEMETLRTTDRRKWTAETELQFLGAKLFLYGWSLKGQAQEPELGILTPTAASEPHLSKKLILYEALRSATDYIHAFSELGSSTTPGRRTRNEELLPQMYFPKYYCYTVYYAALTLYHFLATLPQSSISDQDLARNHIRLAHTVLSRCASHDAESEWPRLARNIEFVGQFINSGRRLPPEAQIKSRQGAGLFYDGMLKIAVLKAEMGGRNWASDLTQPKPYDDNGLMKEEPPMMAPEMPQGPTSSSSAATAFGVHDPQQQYVPQEWDDAFWGWDLSMLDSAVLQQDWNGLDQWQP